MRLAGKSSGDEVRPPTQSICGEFAHVVEDGDAWPASGQVSSTFGEDLAESPGAESNSLKSFTESANAAEAVEYTHGYLSEEGANMETCKRMQAASPPRSP